MNARMPPPPPEGDEGGAVVRVVRSSRVRQSGPLTGTSSFAIMGRQRLLLWTGCVAATSAITVAAARGAVNWLFVVDGVVIAGVLLFFVRPESETPVKWRPRDR